MKKILTTILLVCIVSICTSQETKFSIIAGYSNAFETVKIDAVNLLNNYEDEISFDVKKETINDSYSGFNIGVSVETSISDKISFNPSLLYLNVNNTNFLQAPIFLKYYLNNELSIIGGPQLTYTLDEVFERVRKLNIAIGAGISYNISERFYAQASYSYQLNDYVKDKDYTQKIHLLNIGLGYKL
ncbi:Outer membrane protein beta-barrel domain-containing protein [Lutibacter oricola]|uniref:Outer membrane protein beta-barrel domain-containing protein n=1 Tax=Lutibacter oricola TaxID=762486 RepID=A0A1H2XTK9_9FLAO|nr:outer membrane beta-barrel protein [Lutibacter oricola]SDW96186.1 Outer membrane protein beta-barrel domain-containing protein [Lutibacter oricola]